MKAAILHGPGNITAEEIEKPRLEKDDDIIIRVEACGICGTDLHFYRYGLFPHVGMPYGDGWLMGHEISGEVTAIGAAVEGLTKGDRVVAATRGGQAEYVRIDKSRLWSVLPIPPDISYEEAATTEPLATSLHAVNLALRTQKREHIRLPEPGESPVDKETAVVFGAGIIGLGVLQIMKIFTKYNIIVVDISEKRLQTAMDLGANGTINATREDPLEKMMAMTGKEELRYASGPSSGVAIVFDCVGAPRGMKGTAPFHQALSLVRPGGTIVVVAFFEKQLDIEITDIVAKNVSVHGSLEWSRNEFSRAFELIESRKINRKQAITHRFPLADVKTAYDTQTATDEAVKVMIKPG
jgi:2-desacetyl-2-hydroxyethyl bacteriochlorophyllide A dehydrogenase